MLLSSFPSSFSSIQLTVWEMLFEEFQDVHLGGYLGYRNGTILAILNLKVSPMVWKEMLFEEYQDGCRGTAAILDTGMEQF